MLPTRIAAAPRPWRPRRRRAGRRIGGVAAVDRLVTLLDHAEPLVVEHEHADRQPLGDRGRDLERVHREAAVTADRGDRAVGVRELRADRGAIDWPSSQAVITRN